MDDGGSRLPDDDHSLLVVSITPVLAIASQYQLKNNVSIVLCCKFRKYSNAKEIKLNHNCGIEDDVAPKIYIF